MAIFLQNIQNNPEIMSSNIAKGIASGNWLRLHHTNVSCGFHVSSKDISREFIPQHIQ